MILGEKKDRMSKLEKVFGLCLDNWHAIVQYSSLLTTIQKTRIEFKENIHNPHNEIQAANIKCTIINREKNTVWQEQ